MWLLSTQNCYFLLWKKYWCSPKKLRKAVQKKRWNFWVPLSSRSRRMKREATKILSLNLPLEIKNLMKTLSLVNVFQRDTWVTLGDQRTVSLRKSGPFSTSRRRKTCSNLAKPNTSTAFESCRLLIKGQLKIHQWRGLMPQGYQAKSCYSFSNSTISRWSSSVSKRIKCSRKKLLSFRKIMVRKLNNWKLSLRIRKYSSIWSFMIWETLLLP